MALAGPPANDVDVPESVAALAADRPARCVWQNEAGGLTFEVGAGDERCFVKWAPASSGLDLRAEEVRLGWVAPFDPVPRVIAAGGDAAGAWLVTAPVDGESAVGDRWRARPLEAVTAIGVGLRHLHDTAPVTGADRWADLAIATWSTGWNYGSGYERTLLDAYGIDPDPERTSYYRLLWDLA